MDKFKNFLQVVTETFGDDDTTSQFIEDVSYVCFKAHINHIINVKTFPVKAMYREHTAFINIFGLVSILDFKLVDYTEPNELGYIIIEVPKFDIIVKINLFEKSYSNSSYEWITICNSFIEVIEKKIITTVYEEVPTVPSKELKEILKEEANGKKIQVITYSGLITYNNKDIKDFLDDFDNVMDADNLPKWLYVAGLEHMPGFPKTKANVKKTLVKILNHNFDVIIDVNSGSRHTNEIIYTLK